MSRRYFAEREVEELHTQAERLGEACRAVLAKARAIGPDDLRTDQRVLEELLELLLEGRMFDPARYAYVRATALLENRTALTSPTAATAREDQDRAYTCIVENESW